MDGWLDLSRLTTVEGLKLPKHVGAGLDLRGLTTAEGLEFPEHMGGWLDLSGPASDERDTPATQILIERRGAVEHSGHGHDAADVPRPRSVGRRSPFRAVSRLGQVAYDAYGHPHPPLVTAE